MHSQPRRFAHARTPSCHASLSLSVAVHTGKKSSDFVPPSRPANLHSSRLPGKGACLGEELRQPLEPVRVPHPSDDAAHVQLDGPDPGGPVRALVLPVRVDEAERVLELLLARRGGHVDLVPQHQEGDVVELFARQERVELLLGLGEAAPIDGVDQVHDAVDRGEVVLPQPAGRFVAAQVEGLELDVADDELVCVGVEGGDVDLDAVLLEHVEEGRLPGIVQPQEQDLRVLVVQTLWYDRRHEGGGVQAVKLEAEF